VIADCKELQSSASEPAEDCSIGVACIAFGVERRPLASDEGPHLCESAGIRFSGITCTGVVRTTPQARARGWSY